MAKRASRGRVDGANAARREEVLAAAATVFSNKGYRASTIQDIGAALGFTSGALYYYFDSKSDILNEIVMRPMKHLIAGADRIAEEPGTAVERVRRLIEFHIRSELEERDFFNVLLRERVELDRRAAAKLRDLESEYYDRIQKLVQDGVDAGELQSARPRVAALSLLGMMNWVLRWYQPGGDLDAGDVADEMFAVFYRGTCPA